MAKTVNPEEAFQKAQSFLQSKQPTTRLRSAQAEPQLTLAYTSVAEGETYYYVFNNAEGGFVIIGGDEVAHEVLGYSTTGTFDYDSIPENMRWWLSQYDEAISHAIKEHEAGRCRLTKVRTRSGRPAIAPLLTTKWGQHAPYNSQLPLNQKENGTVTTGDSAYATGCVATAADIAVGEMMRHMGETIDMMYETFVKGGSGTYLTSLAQHLVDTYHYNKGMTYMRRN